MSGHDRTPRNLNPREPSIRAFLNNNTAVVTILAVVMLIFALGIILWNDDGPSRRAFLTYYYDLNTQSLLADKKGKAAPFASGPIGFEYFDGTLGAAVEAFVFTCGDPSHITPGMTRRDLQAAGAYIGYLRRLTPVALALRAKIDAGEALSPEAYDRYHGQEALVADAEGQHWYPMSSPPGRALIAAATQRCGPNKTAAACFAR